MALNLPPTEVNIARIVQAVRQLMMGRTNSTGNVTLRASQTTTVVSAPNVGPTSHVFLTPKTPHAAAMNPQPYVKPADTVLGSFVISHPSVAQSDLDFGWDARG